MRVIIALSAAPIGAVLIARIVGVGIAARQPLPVRNYRSLTVTSGGGLAVILGLAAGTALMKLAVDLTNPPADVRLVIVEASLVRGLMAAVAFGLLGLYDDLAGDHQRRGWSAHLSDLLARRFTPGAVKLAGGLILAIAVTDGNDNALGGGGDGFDHLVRALFVALAANACNGFDVRPLRAAKIATIAMLAFLFFDLVQVAVAATLIASLAGIAKLESQERLILGDTGSMAVGAFIAAAASDRLNGIGPLSTSNHLDGAGLLVALAIASGINILAVRPGWSVIIARVAPLRAFDRLGRIDEPVSES